MTRISRKNPWPRRTGSAARPSSLRARGRPWLPVLALASCALLVAMVVGACAPDPLPIQSEAQAQRASPTPTVRLALAITGGNVPTQAEVRTPAAGSPQKLQLATPTKASPEGQKASATPSNSDVRVEVIHFHATKQCYSCKVVGDLAEKTVTTYFKDELASGRLTFAHINGQLPENRALLDKYGAKSTGLYIGTTVGGSFHKETDIKVWSKIKNEKDYFEYLKGVLTKRLAGDIT